MLPMLFSLLGSGLASAGALGGLGPLAAGAIGAGVGGAIEEGDIGAGIRSGLLSFLGGKMIGGALGAAPLAGPGSEAAAQAAANTAGQTASQAAKPGGILGLLGGSGKVPGFDPTATMMKTPGALAPGMLAKGGALGVMTAPQMLPYVGGAALAPMLSAGYGSMDMPKQKRSNYKKAPAPGQPQARPGEGYNPGVDPEFNWKFPIYGVQYMADGGVVGAQDDPVVADAVAAIKGEIDDPRIPLGRFLQKYGRDALERLIEEVRGGTAMPVGEAMGDMPPRVVRGPGTGRSDSIPAETDSGQKVALSDGEFVVPADVVRDVGEGSPEEGGRRLMELIDMLREEKAA